MMPTFNPADEAFNASVNAKHVRLRGSLALKYYPPDKWCGRECDRRDNEHGRGHSCPLGIGHAGAHEWSSECGATAKGATSDDNA